MSNDTVTHDREPPGIDPRSAALLGRMFGLPPGASAESCAAVLDTLRLHCVLLDPAGRVLFANRYLSEALDIDRATVAGRDWIETYVPAERRARVRTTLARVIARDDLRNYQSPLVVASGETTFVEWDNTVLRDHDGTGLAVLALGKDVTELVHAFDSLREEVARHQNMLDHVIDPIITVDQHALVRGFNRAAERVFGWTARQVVGRNVSMLMPSPDRERHDGYLTNYLRSGEPKIIGIGREVTGLRRDGSEFPMLIGVSEIDDVRVGRLFTSVIRDLTELKRNELELRRAHHELQEANLRLIDEQAKQVQAEKLSSIGLLAAGMAHEINNPLMGVISCVKALRDGHLSAPRREDYYEAIRDGLERIEATLKSLLDYARQRPPAPTDVEPAELIDSCLRLLAPAIRKKELAVELRVDDPALTVHADRSQLLQAFANLLMNAIYAVPMGGHITVSAHGSAKHVALSVADDGPGIDPDVMSKVCDPFFTTKPIGEGTGLGLAVTLGIARAHGGDLRIESIPGRGTTVSLWLPQTLAR